ncbi:hypothetical protein SAMN04487846_3707 [Microbacterium sp. cf046]|uniref:hypothetical protein n=1 Tax=Microbacterium sp. cf046 TaxID=1761803 RepID=UPI0008F0F431|nr:hypothetical protein [Microbacterium sp. cf046]SFS17998.1 hypothetical protein SAMN04487846_3707 [Microbacterium sp. cf046]
MRKHHGHAALSADEQIWRYAYVVGTVPASVADKAYAAAFARLSMAQREDLVDELLSLMPAGAGGPSVTDPEAFAMFMQDLQSRNALVRVRGASAFAVEFIASRPVVAYFTVGTGSVEIDRHPPWIHELAGHETAPFDAGGSHRHGVRFGE